MRLGWSRRLLAAAILVPIVGVALALAFGPCVRALALTEATRHRVSLRIGAVRPAWWGVTLLDLAIRPEGVAGVETTVDRASVSLGWNFRVDHVEVTGVSVRARGTREALLSELRAWRGEPHAPSPPAAGRGPSVSVKGLGFVWFDGASTQPRVEGRDVAISLSPGDARVAIPVATARAGRWSATLGGALIDMSRAGLVQRGRSETLLVRYALGAEANDSRLPEKAPSPKSVLPPLPDLGALRAVMGSVTAAVSERIAPEADVGVDALTWRIESSSEKASLTIGPGPLSLARTPSALEIRFSTDASSSGTPLAVQVLLPLDAADAALTLDGGPISLARLGIREGAAGLVDVAKTTAIGRARMVLAGDGRSLTFDGDGGLHGLSIQNARLAPDVVRDLDLDLRARGIATSQGELRVDDFGVTLGSLQLSAAAALEQDASHLAGTLRAEVASSEEHSTV